MSDPTAEPAGVIRLAADHGLDLAPDSLEFIEMGLDFRVVLARTTAGADWVLRIPRRAEVMVRAAVEARVLRLVAPRLDAAVPDWRIHTGDLIAYPLLPGEPGLEMVDGEPVWQVDVSAPDYAESLGELLSQLHGTDPIEASTTGAPVRTPDYFRQAWREDIERVSREFTVAGHLLDRWETWLSEESYWPGHAVLTHGEIYPGHTLIHDGRITGLLDWTTATVGDPARDFMFHQATASPGAFELTVERYVAGGGRVWPRLAEHCAEMFSANPIAYGLYVLDSGADTHRETAAAQLNPPAE